MSEREFLNERNCFHHDAKPGNLEIRVIACHSSFSFSNKIKDNWLAFCAGYIVSKHPEGQIMHFF